MRRLALALFLLPAVAVAQPTRPPDYVAQALGQTFNETMNAYITTRAALLKQTAETDQVKGDLDQAKQRVKELEDAAAKAAPPK